MDGRTRRRICWPNFDKVCLQGGCSYCSDNELRTVASIRKAADARGLLADFWEGIEISGPGRAAR